MDKISKYYSKSHNKDECQSDFYKAQDQDGMRNYLQKVLSFERFVNLNVWVDELRINKDKEILDLKN